MDNKVINSNQKSMDEDLKGIVTVFVLILIVIAGIIWLIKEPSRIDNIKASYHEAIEKCGVDNTERHDYTNGNTDFTCKDYSKAK